MKKLTIEEISFLKKKFSSFHFSNSFDLVYEKQIPTSGILLLKGGITLTSKGKGGGEVIEPGTLLGVHHLMNNIPVKNGCRISANTEVILFQKSDVLDAIHNPDSRLASIIC